MLLHKSIKVLTRKGFKYATEVQTSDNLLTFKDDLLSTQKLIYDLSLIYPVNIQKLQEAGIAFQILFEFISFIIYPTKFW